MLNLAIKHTAILMFILDSVNKMVDFYQQWKSSKQLLMIVSITQELMPLLFAHVTSVTANERN